MRIEWTHKSHTLCLPHVVGLATPQRQHHPYYVTVRPDRGLPMLYHAWKQGAVLQVTVNHWTTGGGEGRCDDAWDDVDVLDWMSYQLLLLAYPFSSPYACML